MSPLFFRLPGDTLSWIVRCEYCQNETRIYFQVERRKEGDESSSLSTRVCSILCMLRWGYSYIHMQGQQGVAQVAALVDQVKNVLKG
jgi:hypothetical protein